MLAALESRTAGFNYDLRLPPTWVKGVFEADTLVLPISLGFEATELQPGNNRNSITGWHKDMNPFVFQRQAKPLGQEHSSP